MRVILDEKKLAQAIEKIAESIIKSVSNDASMAVVGIRSRGEILAKRLAGLLTKKLQRPIQDGTLDITLYRDDLNEPGSSPHPTVRTTEITFDVDDKIIILADDVLYTGRSVRAAMDALVDLGRPRAIRLAVLVERPGREFPIQADFTGHKLEIENDKPVEVNFTETDRKDQVIIK